MSKKLRTYEINIAPEISGVMENGYAVVFDKRNLVDINPNTLEGKIIIYERQVKDWFLSNAVEINSDKNGFIVLMICMSYVEGVERYRKSQNSVGSRVNFVNSIKRILDDASVAEVQLSSLYREARCGLFHNGMSSKQIIISNLYDDSIDFSEAGAIKINPEKLLNLIIIDFNKYIEVLKNPLNTELRNRFNQKYSVT